jgi:hypothetical protein
MLYLLLAVGLCLLVPWVPVLMYWRLPRRPPPPLTDRQLQQLAGELRPAAPEGDPTTDITGAELAPPDGPSGAAAAEDRATAPAPAAPPRRLSMGPYRWVNVLMAVVLSATFLALGALWALLFHYLGEARARSFGPAVFLFKPFAYGIVCALPALFLGIFSSPLPGVLFVRLLLGRRRFLEYLFWDEGRLAAGGGATADGVIRMLTHFALLVGVLSVLFVCLVMNWYARFTEDGVAVKRLLAVREEVHPYAGVEQLVLTTHRVVKNKTAEREDIHIRFADGKTWETDETFSLPADAAERKRFLDFLQEKTGRPVTRARLIQDVPGW